MFVRENWDIFKLLNELNNSGEKELYFDWNNYTDESLGKISNMLKTIDSLKDKYTVIVRFNKVNEAELTNILNLSNTNVKIIIDNYTYSLDEFKLLNKKLNNLIKDIELNDSPYEKYSKIYDIVRKYKEYKIIDQSNVKSIREAINNKSRSDNLKYILENKYMDCRGFSNLLQTLLNKCGIESYTFGFNVTLPNGIHGGHDRVMINLDDDKYNIHGIFISDPTWDSESKDNELKYSLLPFSSMQDPMYEECKEYLLFSARTDDELIHNLTLLKNNPKLYQDMTKEIITLVNRIDRKESAKLKTIDTNQFYSELEDYILTKNNTNKNHIGSSYGK